MKKELERAERHGLNYIIGSDDDPVSASAKSYEMHKPLRDPSVVGKQTKDKIRPDWVNRFNNRIDKLQEQIDNTSQELSQKTRDAAKIAKGRFLYFIILVLFPADGIILGPVIANILHAGDIKYAVLLLGLSVSLMIGVTGWGIGYVTEKFFQPPVSHGIAATVAGLFGAVVGGAIGWLDSEGQTMSAAIRAALTGGASLTTAVIHNKFTEISAVWGPVREVKKELKEQIKERDRLIGEVRDYQESVIDDHQNHRAIECSEYQGMRVGKQARQEGVRASYVPQRLSSLADKLLRVFPFIVVASFTANYALASEKVVVLDVTSSVPVKEILLDRLLDNISLDYGETVEAYTLGCNGLAFAYRGEVSKRSKARHKQSLKKVTGELRQSLEQAAKSGNTKCSPLIDSLALLGTDLQMRAKQGVKLTAVIASDFETNSDRFRFDPAAFKGIKVVAVMPPGVGL